MCDDDKHMFFSVIQTGTHVNHTIHYTPQLHRLHTPLDLDKVFEKKKSKRLSKCLTHFSHDANGGDREKYSERKFLAVNNI